MHQIVGTLLIKYLTAHCKLKSSISVIVISLAVITLSFIIISGLKKFNCDSINQKKFLCLSFAIIAQSCFYIFNEFSEIYFYSIIEQFTRDILFFFAFYFFLKDLNVLTDRQKTYKLCMLLISIILIFSVIELFIRLFYNQDCLLDYIKIKIAIKTITIISFLIIANNWIKSLIEQFFFQIRKKKSRSQQKFQQNISFIDRNYLVSQLFKLKILVFIYFFTQSYKITKSIFFLVLNSEFSENGICLSLYGQEKDVKFYSYFDKELEYFKAIKLGEYVFRLIFCYLIPVAIILLIMRGEKKRAKGISESLTTDSIQKISQTDLIKGLNFHYDEQIIQQDFKNNLLTENLKKIFCLLSKKI